MPIQLFEQEKSLTVDRERERRRSKRRRMHLIASSSGVCARQTGTRRIRRHHRDSDLAPSNSSDGSFHVRGALHVDTTGAIGSISIIGITDGESPRICGATTKELG